MNHNLGKASIIFVFQFFAVPFVLGAVGISPSVLGDQILWLSFIIAIIGFPYGIWYWLWINAGRPEEEKNVSKSLD